MTLALVILALWLMIGALLAPIVGRIIAFGMGDE